MILLVLLGLTAALALPAQTPRFQAVGLVMGRGATVQRGQVAPKPVPPGEVLFSGDIVQAGKSTVPLLYCPERMSATLSPNGQVALRDREIEVRSGSLTEKKEVAACYLPAMPRLSLASQQHFGVLLARSGSIPPPSNTFEERVAALPEDRRTVLRESLEMVDNFLDFNPKSAAGHISRATALEKAGLLYDAGESYRKAAGLFPEAAWIRRKIYEIEDVLLKASGR